MAGGVACAALGLPVADAAAQVRSKPERKSERLALAGFEAMPATTPERKAMLARLPFDRFSTRVRGDQVLYVYPDQQLCGCIYLGTQDAYGRYRRIEAVQKLAADRRPAVERYTDAKWNWNAWTPLAPAWAAYRLGAEPGW